MNPLSIIGETFLLAGRQGGYLIRINWWIFLLLAAGLVSLSWLSLRFLEIFPSSLGMATMQVVGIGVAMAPQFLVLVATGLMVGRYMERSRTFPVLRDKAKGDKFLQRWIGVSFLVFAGLVVVEFLYGSILESNMNSGTASFQGGMFIVRNYAATVVFLAGLCFLLVTQNMWFAEPAASRAGGKISLRHYLAMMAAGFALYFVVEPTLEQMFLYLPPMGFYWATLDRLQPPYFFLTETARIGARTLAPIFYVAFIVMASEAVRRSRT